MVRASYLQGTALRAFMIGATPLGVTRQAKSSYLAGVGEALKTP